MGKQLDAFEKLVTDLGWSFRERHGTYRFDKDGVSITYSRRGRGRPRCDVRLMAMDMDIVGDTTTYAYSLTPLDPGQVSREAYVENLLTLATQDAVVQLFKRRANMNVEHARHSLQSREDERAALDHEIAKWRERFLADDDPNTLANIFAREEDA